MKNVGIYSLFLYVNYFNEKMISVVDMLYGGQLKAIRTRMGVTQKTLADLINVDKSLYNRYEKEIQLIPLKHLIIICNYFNVSLDYIFGFNELKQYPSLNLNVIKTLSGIRLKEFRKENKITQNKLADFLNTTHSVISDYERGRYLIATPFLYQMCQKYHISADYLLGKIDHPKYLN